MFKKLSLFLVIIALLAFIIGCETNLKQGSDDRADNISELENSAFDNDYRPSWWDAMTGAEYLYSYAYMDGINKETIKVKAIAFAQTRLLHYKKDYVVNLTEIIVNESNSKGNFTPQRLSSINKLVYEANYAQYLKRFETEYVKKDETEFRCFVAIGLPIVDLQNKYVTQFQKSPNVAGVFAKSETYQFLLKQAGLTALPFPKQIIPEKQEVAVKPAPGTPTIKYDEDVAPAWYKISYNNLKVMVNKTATAGTAEQAESQAISRCRDAKMTAANDFARAEAERYRKASGYNELEFNDVKNAISAKVKNINYSLTQEHLKTLHIGEQRYVTYAQYSINKKAIEQALVEALKADDVLYSRLRANMMLDEVDDEF